MNFCPITCLCSFNVFGLMSEVGELGQPHADERRHGNTRQSDDSRCAEKRGGVKQTKPGEFERCDGPRCGTMVGHSALDPCLDLWKLLLKHLEPRVHR